MGIKVGINGFGRIGRMVFRAGLKNPNIEFVAVNDPFMTPDYMAYMLKYDTMHGRYDGTIEYDENSITVDGKKVLFFAEMDPKNIPWGKVGADYVVESTSVKGRHPELGSVHIRRTAVERAIPCLTSMDTVSALLRCLEGDIKIENCEMIDINSI